MDNAVGYIRVSTLKQVKGHSLAYQEDAIRNYCKTNKINLVRLFSDKGLSGYKKRTQLDKMYNYIKTNNINYVITYTITRYGRSTQDLLNKITMLKEMGVTFVSIKEQIDISTKIGKLMLTMLSAIADFEGETIRERMEAGRKWAQEHGTKSGNPLHRPKKEIPWERVKSLRRQGLSWTSISKVLSSDEDYSISHQTLIKRAKDEGYYD